MNSIINLVNKKSLKKSIPDIATGDVVRVSQRIVEGNKSRVQVFEGMVIERCGGNGVAASITVRKIASGVGVEKKFLLNSPNVEGVKILRSSKVRRKKIFFLRGLTGKAAKLKDKQRKMLGEIGLKEDEAETAENTEDIVEASVESENVTPESEKEETQVAEEPKAEETPVEEVKEEIAEEEPKTEIEEKTEEPAVVEEVKEDVAEVPAEETQVPSEEEVKDEEPKE